MPVTEYLERAAARFPEKKAFADNGRELTYAGLLDASERGASVLIRELGVRRKPIAVMVERNVTCIPAFMAVLMSGNFYVPVGSALPPERVKGIFDQMQPEAVIDCAHIMSEEEKGSYGLPFYDIDSLMTAEKDLPLIAGVKEEITDDDPVYAICTSGSTGVPKGVVKSHRSVMDFIPIFVSEFGFSGEDVFGNQAPFDFDVSGKDIYSALYLGASVFIIPTEYFMMPKKLVAALDDNHVSVLVWAVSALCIVAAVNAFKKRVPANLKKVLFSGEVMPVKLLNVWRKYLPDVTYVNLYGPTEVTYNCMYYKVDREFSDTEKLPLGKVFRNQQVMFLKEDNTIAGRGETGEICVAGTSLALGYYRNMERTEKAFVQNPFNEAYPERMYRTGDLALHTENDEFYFMGRKDFQIKHMGHRIELEEIELYIGAVDGVQRVCCMFDDVRNKIVACYSGEPDNLEIINALKTEVPKYMIPSVFVKLETLPLNKNGKTDRKLLRQIYEDSLNG